MNLQGNWNYYALSVTGTASTFNLNIDTLTNATNYLGKVIPGCSAVNYNDFFNDVYFYNAKALGIGF